MQLKYLNLRKYIIYINGTLLLLVTCNCLLDGGLGFKSSRNPFSSGIMFSSNGFLCSNRKTLFNKEDVMFDIKETFLNKQQAEDGKSGDLGEKRWSYA